MEKYASRGYVPAPRWKWHFYDNDGSYNGWFDRLPRKLRFGPWSPFAGIFLASWFVCMCLYLPEDDLKVSVPAHWSAWWWWDAFLACWGIVVLVFCKVHYGVGPILTSYTMWSWILLTFNAFCSSAGALLSNVSIGEMLLRIRELTRFPTVVGATVTWFLWNFLLCPLIYFFHCSTDEAKNRFRRLNFGFFMINVHTLNLPVVVTTLAVGGDGGGVRQLNLLDLWCGLLVAFAYALLYLFVVDRAGLHFYPMFSPRTHFCVLSYSVLIALYVGCWRSWNLLIDYIERT